MSRTDGEPSAETLAVLAEIGALVAERAELADPDVDDLRLLRDWSALAVRRIVFALGPPFTRQRCRAEWLRAASLLVAAVEALDRRGEA